MQISVRCWSFAALALVTAGPSLAQGTISLGDAQFVRTASSWDSSPEANLRGVSLPLTDDHLYEFGWWFRVAGDTQETPFPFPDSQSYDADQSDLAWNNVGGRSLFSAFESAGISTGNGDTNGHVYVWLTILNLSAVNPLTLEIFNLADFDLQPTVANDTARLVEWTPLGILQLNDAGENFAQYSASRQSGSPIHYLVRPYGANDVGAVLSDASITDFDDSGTPFGPGDLTAGWQFSITVAPSAMVTLAVYLRVNLGYNCSLNNGTGLFCDGLELGNPSLWSAAVP